MNVVEITNLRKTYGGQVALADVSLTIATGEVFALLGPNGAGKTSLLRILTGILLPDGGSVRILGAEGIRAVRDFVGYVPEERGLYKKQKIGDTLQYLGELRGLSAKEARSHTREALERVGMLAHENSLVESLSKGMAQRIQFASALVHDPPFLILDEPFTGLDPVSARQMQDIVRSEKERGRTILLSTHQMEAVEKFCDRLLMLYRGRTVLYGSVQEVRERFAEGILRVEHTGEALPPLPENFTVLNDLPRQARLRPPVEMPLPEVVSTLLAAGVALESFIVEKPSLEDIFVRVVGESGEEAID